MTYARESMGDATKALAAALRKGPKAVNGIFTGTLAHCLLTDEDRNLKLFCFDLNHLLRRARLSAAVARHPILREHFRVPVMCRILAVGPSVYGLAGITNDLGTGTEWRHTHFLKIIPGGIRYAGTLRFTQVNSWVHRQRIV